MLLTFFRIVSSLSKWSLVSLSWLFDYESPYKQLHKKDAFSVFEIISRKTNKFAEFPAILTSYRIFNLIYYLYSIRYILSSFCTVEPQIVRLKVWNFKFFLPKITNKRVYKVIRHLSRALKSNMRLHITAPISYDIDCIPMYFLVHWSSRKMDKSWNFPSSFCFLFVKTTYFSHRTPLWF